jgi:hypothetical protein
LTLAIDNSSDITEQVGEMSFGAFAPPGREGIEVPIFLLGCHTGAIASL